MPFSTEEIFLHWVDFIFLAGWLFGDDFMKVNKYTYLLSAP